MSEIPPKQPVSGTASARVQSAYGLPPLPEADRPPDIDATEALVSLHHAATQSGPDSFPVLKAFQDYLESERRRARRRVALVTSLFAGIVVIVIGVFLTAGMMMFGYMKEIQDNLWRKLEAQTAAAAAAPAAAVPPPPPAPAGEQAGAPANAELKKLAEALADLKRDNEALRGKLAAPPAVPVTVQAPATVAAPAAAAPVTVQASPVTVQAAPPAAAPAAVPRLSTLVIPEGVKAPPPPAGYAESGIYLQPGGRGAPIPWRVFMPAP